MTFNQIVAGAVPAWHTIFMQRASDRELEPLRRRVALHELDSHFIWELQRDDIETLLNGLDLLVSASEGEGFSNVIAEAMATGVPCVVTDVGDSKAIVGDCGIVVPPKNSCALAKGISQMLSTGYLGNASHLARSRSRIVEKFSVAKLTLETERCLTALVSGQIDE